MTGPADDARRDALAGPATSAPHPTTPRPGLRLPLSRPVLTYGFLALIILVCIAGVMRMGQYEPKQRGEGSQQGVSQIDNRTQPAMDK